MYEACAALHPVTHALHGGQRLPKYRNSHAIHGKLLKVVYFSPRLYTGTNIHCHLQVCERERKADLVLMLVSVEQCKRNKCCWGFFVFF